MGAPGGPAQGSNYHSPLRARQAAETRRSIIDSAVILFQQGGWSATTLPMIARHAGVSVDTIYATFGTKSSLLLAAVERAIVGDDEEAAMADRPEFAALGQGPRAERLRAGVRYTMDVYDRSVPILRTLREAAASDERALERYRRYDQDRHDLVAAGMALILGREASAELADAMWALVSPEVYTHLLEGRDWSRSQIEDWFVALATAAIARN